MTDEPRGAGADSEARRRDAVTAVLPLGATEQHGRHLPVDTDTRIAAAIAARAVDALGDDAARVVLLPPLAFGASGEHAGFPGLVSIGTDALVTVLVEIGRSVCEWADRLLVVNAHGGNLVALRRAVPQLRAEGRDVAWFACATAVDSADSHAGRGETSIMLALDPSAVDLDAAEPGCLRPLAEILPEMRAGGVAAVSPNGVLGDPRGATAQLGRSLLETNVEAAARVAAASFSPDSTGRVFSPDPAQSSESAR